jgi:hypothetical protein
MLGILGIGLGAATFAVYLLGVARPLGMPGPYLLVCAFGLQVVRRITAFLRVEHGRGSEVLLWLDAIVLPQLISLLFLSGAVLIARGIVRHEIQYREILRRHPELANDHGKR